MNIILAPHLDDEIVGCYSVLHTIDTIIYFHNDYRAGYLGSIQYTLDEYYHHPDGKVKYIWWDDIKMKGFIASETDTIYVPSKYDFHPLHKKVNRIGLSLPGKKMFYSVEMNVPWLEEEENPDDKRALLQEMYPGEIGTLGKNDKYFLFKSIKGFDSIIWASMKFERELYHRWPAAPNEVEFLRNKHRHKFYFTIEIQQFADDRDLEYFITSHKIQAWFDKQAWAESTSCEMFALAIKTWLETEYQDRLVRVKVMEDNENGALVE